MSSNSTSYLPTSVTTTLQSLEDSITLFLTQLFENLPPFVQTYLLAISSSPYLTRTNLQYSLRLIVIISTYLLFRPHLEALFRRATGTPDARREELQNRLKFLQDLKEGKVKPQGGVEVVDGKVVLRPNPVKRDAEGAKAKGRGQGKVVKLVVPGDEVDVGVQDAAQSDSMATPNTRASTRRRKA
ncbi:uncharacterized protein A1O9_09821 [Exophiala aquamarina CBS 119918]|uniref:Uncharacterized protein n=1 Tax=Exophiala aquamarina CBS 119918 TaxID=1182545 RepID=A0A072P2D6_9EURO|nr:uncharacterized protein A1O9_09821 [Exophiala aquamarina CBS 119918]KEF54026.1 hypothetical protein A1O9_09821 [Exophiala aquamarina CBS 119918]